MPATLFDAIRHIRRGEFGEAAAEIWQKFSYALARWQC